MDFVQTTKEAPNSLEIGGRLCRKRDKAGVRGLLMVTHLYGLEVLDITRGGCEGSFSTDIFQIF